jgi:hypothetical protein
VRIILRLLLTLGFFFLAAISEGTPFYYVFAIVGFWVFSSAFKRSVRSVPEPRGLSISEAQKQDHENSEKVTSLGAVEKLAHSEPSESSQISDGDFVGLARLSLDVGGKENYSTKGSSRSVPYRRVALVLICILSITSILLIVKSLLPPLDAPMQEAAPFLVDNVLPNVWDQSACLESKYPILRLGPEMFSPALTQQAGWQRGEYTAGLSCAFDWDDEQVAQQVGILRSHGLLMIQWNPETIKEAGKMAREKIPAELATMLPQKLPEDPNDLLGPHFGNLSRLVEGLAMAVVEPKLPAPAPDVDSRARARKELAISSTTLPLRSVPRKIVINDSNPRISLYTDIPDTMTLADLGSEAGVLLGGAFEKYNGRLDFLGGNGLPTLALAPDLFSRYLIGQLRAIVINEVRRRSPSLPPLSNIDIIYLKRPAPPEILGQSVRRVGLYRGDLGVIYVRRLFNVSYRDGLENIMSVVSSDFLHEIDHYFRDSPRNQNQPFLLEGQATFDGEEEMRPVLAAVHLHSEITLSKAIGSLDLPREEFERFAAKRLAREGMSENQRRILCHALTLIKTNRFSLENFLTVSPARLALMDDNFHRDFYSAAWVAYGALRQDNDWPPRFRAIATSVLKEDVTPELRGELDSTQARIVHWALGSAEKERLTCRE